MPKKRNSKSRIRSNKFQSATRKIELTPPPGAAGRLSLPKSLLELQSPSAHARSRWHAIPLLFEDSGATRQVSGRIGYDSWAGTAIGLRDIDDGHVRHLKFEAGSTKIELVAERRNRGWDFVARVYTKAAVAHEFVIEANRKRILPQSDGFYLWTSTKLLRSLRLVSLDRQIVIGGITW
jgi:hypothetical protein